MACMYVTEKKATSKALQAHFGK